MGWWQRALSLDVGIERTMPFSTIFSVADSSESTRDEDARRVPLGTRANVIVGSEDIFKTVIKRGRKKGVVAVVDDIDSSICLCLWRTLKH